ncbi:MAG: hypothetical protein V7K50_05235 [Nostoc sp.]|uniref:hypothetical protein n=1 Tax=Nostoc sp. TaxID=1180 RepID=UPI002FFA45B1
MHSSSFNGRLCDRNSGDSMLSDLIPFGDIYDELKTSAFLQSYASKITNKMLLYKTMAYLQFPKYQEILANALPYFRQSN